MRAIILKVDFMYWTDLLSGFVLLVGSTCMSLQSTSSIKIDLRKKEWEDEICCDVYVIAQLDVC